MPKAHVEIEGSGWAFVQTGEGLAPLLTGSAPAVPGHPGHVPPAHTYETPEQARIRAHLVQEGANAFGGLVETWTRGFADEEAEQPDRALALSDAMTRHSREIMAFVQQAGGLSAAVQAVLPRTPGEDDLDVKRRARQVAANIAQVSSIFCPDLAEHLEYTREWTTLTP